MDFREIEKRGGGGEIKLFLKVFRCLVGWILRGKTDGAWMFSTRANQKSISPIWGENLREKGIKAKRSSLERPKWPLHGCTCTTLLWDREREREREREILNFLITCFFYSFFFVYFFFLLPSHLFVFVFVFFFFHMY